LDGQNGDEIRVAITKNLTPVVGALSGDIMSNNKSVGVFVQCFVSLSTGNTLTVRVKNMTDTHHVQAVSAGMCVVSL